MYRKLFSFVLLLFGIGSAGWTNRPPAAAAQRSPRLQRTAEFTYELFSRRGARVARFNPTGGLVFLFRGLDLQVVDWKTSNVVASASYATLPCDWENPSISGVFFVPGRTEAVVSYCDSLYVVDSVTLAIKNRFFSRPEDLITGVAVSPDGKTIAVSTLTEGVGPPCYVYMFSSESYQQLARWTVDTRSLAFSQDGGLLAIGLSAGNTPDDKFVRRTGVGIRRVPSGEIVSEWWRERSDGYIHNPRFVPGHPNLIATELNRCTSFLFEFWEASTGRRVGEAVHGHVDDQCWRTHEVFAPDWSWAVTTHWNDPDDTDYIQDLVVCDPLTGRVFYETPRRYWTSFDHLAFHTGILFLASPKGLVLADVSKDGRYLLTLEYDRFVVHEVVREASSTTRPE